MSQEQYKGFLIFSSLIAVAGLILMFVSVSWGTGLANSWLSNEMGGMADTSQYNLVVETYTNNFVIIGSILFAVGVVSVIVTYSSFVILRKRLETIEKAGVEFEEEAQPDKIDGEGSS